MMFKLGSFHILALIIGLPAFADNGKTRADVPVEPRFELRQRCSVNGARLYLSDVAKCFGSQALCKEATGIDVASSPLAGRSGFIQKSAIEALLEKE